MPAIGAVVESMYGLAGTPAPPIYLTPSAASGGEEWRRVGQGAGWANLCAGVETEDGEEEHHQLSPHAAVSEDQGPDEAG